MPQWQELSGALTNHGTLMGWKTESRGPYYSSFHATIQEYSCIASKQTIEQWSCDISRVDGFHSSKSNLYDFETTDHMVEANSRSMIDALTQEKLAANLSHNEIRIIHSPNTSDCFAQYRWDRRTWLINGGGSHHLAAAKYIAARIGEKVPLTGKLHIYSLDEAAVMSLRRTYDVFAISDDSFVSNAFMEAMRAYKATWLWHDLPRPYRSKRAILLPKNELRSARIAKELRKAGVLDLGAHLAGLAKGQEKSIFV